MADEWVFGGWVSFREWYYSTIVRRPFDGRMNEKERRGDQQGEQEFFDLWRKHMGFDAPWANVDMLMYDNGKALALADVKIGEEQFGKSNRKALIDLARRSFLPLYEFRWRPDEKKLEVTQIVAVAG